MSETETLFMSAAIGKHEGSYPLHLAADLTDGCFEILRIGKLPRRELAWYFPSMLQGKLPKGHPHVHRTRCRRLEVVAAEGIPIHLDGELPHGADAIALKRFTLEVLPQAIPCLHSPQCGITH
jgi:diacylglycerol kinase family enzyme